MRRFGLLGAAALLGLAACQPAETPQQVQARAARLMPVALQHPSPVLVEDDEDADDSDR